jgi:hypothetical protein
LTSISIGTTIYGMGSLAEDTRYFEVYKVAMDKGEVEMMEMRLAGSFSDDAEAYTVEDILLEFTREQRYRNGFGRGCGQHKSS